MTRRRGFTVRWLALALALMAGARSVQGQVPDSVTIRVVNMDLRTAVQLIGQYLDRPIVFTGDAAPTVTLETPRPVPRSDVIRILRGLLDAHNYEFVDDTAARIYRARQKEVAAPPPPAQTPGVAPRQGTPNGPLELFMIQLKHARADDVASTLNALYGKGSATEGGERRQTLGDELRAIQVPMGGPVPQAVPGTAGRAAVLTGEITIVPDARANSLLVRSNRNDFQLIDAVVQQIDVRPLQVLIEVLIAEVQRDRSLAFGVNATLPPTRIPGTTNTVVEGSVIGAGSSSGSVGLGDFVVKVMGLGGADIEATLRAAAGRGDVSIMSRPVVITANNEEAEIVVGSQRPFIQVSRSLPTDAAVRDQIVQYKEVGTKLGVRPTISADGLVQLEVTQEVSNATSETAFNAPVISTRSVQTQLLVRDGQTVVLGGLTDKQKDVSQSGVPFLSSIPILGGLFGRYSKRITETELFIFLTPRVIRTDEDAAKLSDPLLKTRGEEAMSACRGASAIIGESSTISHLREMIEMAAPTKLPVLIEGPTGAGKELVAAAMHESSGRRGAFVAFNVCAIGESMFEDALFGHVRGAYTGALNDSPGFLVEADRGTAFFDEIGGLQVGLQAKLLRAIETGEFRPIGGKRDVRSDFRVVAATNEGINQLVAERRVRADLAHRIGAVVLTVPSLAQRPEDVPMLVRHFLDRAGRTALSVTNEATKELQEYHWPGNVRELKQVVEWAAVMATTALTVECVRAALSHRAQPRMMSEVSMAERRELRDVLNRHAWNTESAARELGVHRATLYRRMKHLRLTALSPRRGRSGETGESEARAC